MRKKKLPNLRKPMPPPSKRHGDKRRKVTQADIEKAVKEILRRVDMTDSCWDDDYAWDDYAWDDDHA
jgi:hypothetical protein